MVIHPDNSFMHKFDKKSANNLLLFTQIVGKNFSCFFWLGCINNSMEFWLI